MALNAICPYFTMFPLRFPLGILARAKPELGTWVLDPFSGRGTKAYAGRLLGLPSIAIDSSPVAAAITRAKLANATPADIVAAAREILDGGEPPRSVPEGELWELAYHADVLNTICRLREGLLDDSTSDARQALRGVILGALHGPRPKRADSYLSNQCQRTYAPKPRYAVGFWRARNLRPPRVSVLDVIRRRAERYYSYQRPATAIVVQADSREAFHIGEARVGWIVTSPPYYGLRTYLPDQWLRHWFTGGPPQVVYSAQGQLSHATPEAFARDLRRVWCNIEHIAKPGARMIIRFGGIADRRAEPLGLLRSSLEGTRWRIETIRCAGTPAAGRRQALHFSVARNSARAEHDIWV